MTTFSYDGFDRPARTMFADSSYEENTAYDSAGNVLTKRTRSGNTIVFTYDALNRVATKAPQGELTVTYGYDAAGRIDSVSDSNGAFTYGFDTAKRVTSETRPDSKEVQYQYDSNGNRTRITWPDSYYVTYEYDELNRMTAVKENGTTSIATYGYDAASRRSGTSFGNGAVAGYSYFANGDLKGLTQTFASGSVAFDYTYNKIHQQTQAVVSDDTYVLKPGSAASIAYTPNDVNQYTAVAAAAPSYDGNGNLTGDGVNTFGYDTENRLTSFSAAGHAAAYAYDPLGRRASKTVDGIATAFLSAGSQEIAEYDGSGNLLRRNIFGPGLDEPVLRIDCSGSGCSTAAKYFAHADGLGSVIALTDSSDAVTETDTYSPYGESTATAGVSASFRKLVCSWPAPAPGSSGQVF